MLASCQSIEAGVLQDFDSVHVVFVEEHSRSFVSGFGHLFVCLPEAKVFEVDDLLGSTALNFGADTSALGKGIWVGEYNLQPCHELVRKNIHFEQRQLTIFELDLSEDQLSVLRKDLKRRLSREYPYDFLWHNCGHYIWDWLNGPEEDGTGVLYLTPREALDRILALFPPRRIRTIRSDLEILEDVLTDDRGVSRQSLREALSDPAKLRALEDAETRLLAIKVAESRAGSGEFRALQALRAETLAEPGGPEAARRVIARRSRMNGLDEGAWPMEAEGPKISAFTTFHLDEGLTGIRVLGEAGLRDSFTEPKPKHLWREARYLAVTLESLRGSIDAEVLIVSISTLRDSRSLLGGASSGVSVGYTDLSNALGTSGLFVLNWGGLSIQTEAGWLGARLSLVADELHAQAGLNLAPGLTWDLLLPSHAAHIELHHSWSAGVGWLLRHDLILDNSAAMRTEWTRTPDRQDVLSLSLQLRF